MLMPLARNVCLENELLNGLSRLDSIILLLEQDDTPRSSMPSSTVTASSSVHITPQSTAQALSGSEPIRI